MNAHPTILVVDDSAESRELIVATMCNEPYEVITAEEGAGALATIESSAPDVVLLDFQMPGLDGFEICRQIRMSSRHQLLPIVMITGYTDLVHRLGALEAGADDFLSKPIEQVELLARVRSLLRVKKLRDRLEDSSRVVFALAKAAEAKDDLTLEHTERVADNACVLAAKVGLPLEMIEEIRYGALIHDIGKIALADGLLNKEGPLTAGEFEAVKQHTVAGAAIVAPLGSRSELVAIVRHHHERYDGAGYPDGLAGEAIPLSARIVAICDAFDAMVNDRPYRKAMSVARAASTLLAGANEQWDGKLVASFVASLDQSA